MASTFIEGALPRGRNALDVPVAALAGLSVAFVAFAAPADMLARLVEGTGLAGMLPAAEPPFGANARIAIAAAGAIVMFAVAFLLLRWLDRFGSGPGRSREADEQTAETPRLRRRDFHPDAPARRPILAGEELSEPEPFVAARPAREPEPEAEPEPVPLILEVPEPPVAATPPWLEPEAAREEEVPASQPAPAAVERASIAELLERLEQGIARRRGAPPAAAAPPAPTAPTAVPSAPPPQPFPQANDDRLQSAIESLQRLAARND